MGTGDPAASLFHSSPYHEILTHYVRKKTLRWGERWLVEACASGDRVWGSDGMSGDENRELVERFWRAMNTNDWQAVGALLHDDYTLDWPQSGERIRGRDHFAAVNAHYPAAGRWRFTPNRVVADASGAASDVTVTDGVRSDRALSFFAFRDGRIWRMTEYWPEPFAAPAWRARWVEPME
jgi:ketosteroid isomerase-like protein